MRDNSDSTCTLYLYNVREVLGGSEGYGVR